MRYLFILTLAAAALAGSARQEARAANNPALCFALANNYNACVRNRQGGGYGGGYGRHGGYGGYDDGYEGGYGRRGGYGGYGGGYGRPRGGGNCNQILMQLKSMGCW